MTEAGLPDSEATRKAGGGELPVQALLDALREGDGQALDRLLPLLRERLVAVAKRRLQGADAEEAVQETLAIMWEKRSAIRSARHLLQFAFQTLRHVIGNAWLKRRRRGEADVPADAGRATGDWWAPESGARAEEFERLLERAVARCAKEHPEWGRILSWLRAGLTPPEIHERLGDVPMATVHTRIHRARGRLAAILREEFGVEGTR